MAWLVGLALARLSELCWAELAWLSCQAGLAGLGWLGWAVWAELGLLT